MSSSQGVTRLAEAANRPGSVAQFIAPAPDGRKKEDV